MTDFSTWALIGLSLVLGAWAVTYVVGERAFDNPLLYGLALLEVLVLVQLVAGVVAAIVADRSLETVTFVGYLITSVLILPVAVIWAVTEKSRWGVAVIAFGCVTVAALLLRAAQVWAAPGV